MSEKQAVLVLDDQTKRHFEMVELQVEFAESIRAQKYLETLFKHEIELFSKVNDAFVELLNKSIDLTTEVRQLKGSQYISPSAHLNTPEASENRRLTLQVEKLKAALAKCETGRNIMASTIEDHNLSPSRAVNAFIADVGPADFVKEVGKAHHLLAHLAVSGNDEVPIYSVSNALNLLNDLRDAATEDAEKAPDDNDYPFM